MSRTFAAASITALLTAIVLTTTFWLPNDGALPFLVTAGVVGIVVAAFLTRLLRANLLVIPLGLIVGYILFSFVFYIFIYEPR
jgi:hypothetical protein